MITSGRSPGSGVRLAVQSGGMTPSHIGSIQWPVVIASRLYRCGGSVGIASVLIKPCAPTSRLSPEQLFSTPEAGADNRQSNHRGQITAANSQSCHARLLAI